MFPSFYLTGNIAQQALNFGDLFKSASKAYAVGPLVEWPIFRAGEIRAKVRASEAQADAAAYAYETAVLTALEDTETALLRYGEEFRTRDFLAESAASYRRAVSLAKQRYKFGEDGVLSIIDAEKELVAIEQHLALSETRLRTNLVSLYKALGGGWELFDYQAASSN